MNPEQNDLTSRRDFLKTTGQLAAATALAGVSLPNVHAAGSDQLQIALVGCGGRGTGAVGDALICSGPPKLVAMADVFENKLKNSHDALKRKFKEQVNVAEDKKFIGFDGYQKAMDCLKPGDIVILATPLAFRWVHFKYAIEKGLNVFMEKPIAADPVTAQKMIALAQEAKKKNLKVAVGLMVRHCRGRRELFDQIQDGKIGDIIALRAYRMHGPQGSAFTDPSMRKPDQSELMFQISRFHSFIWLSGGLFSDFYIHQIDECCWMKNAWPVKAMALGGRHYRGDNIDQNFDHYQVEYTYADGSKLFFYGRTMLGCKDDFSSYAHGSKGQAVITQGSHFLQKAGRIYKSQNMTSENLLWSAKPAPSPYESEWQDLIAAIQHDEPYNEVERAAMASMVTSLGRFSAHTGQEVLYEDYMKQTAAFAEGVDKLTLASASPVPADEKGRYPIPEPGLKKDREY